MKPNECWPFFHDYKNPKPICVRDKYVPIEYNYWVAGWYRTCTKCGKRKYLVDSIPGEVLADPNVTLEFRGLWAYRTEK